MNVSSAFKEGRPELCMPLFMLEEVLEVTGARVWAGDPSERLRRGVARLCTDSRTTRPGDLFVALVGERFDGHRFVDAAFRRGAVGALVQDQDACRSLIAASPRPTSRQGALRRNPLLLGVPDTLQAYQRLAAYHRNRFRIPLVAVTGSNGKTTTKDMTAYVLAERGFGLKTEGNLNNRIGVPQTLLRLTGRHRTAVVEMGVDRPGQTTRLCEIARPTIGLITNIGPDHLEFFGSLDVSAQAKGELLDALPEDGGAVLNADDPYFSYLAARARCPVLSFGFASGARVRAIDVSADPRKGLSFGLVLPERRRATPVALAVHGRHNLANALAAAAVGHLIGLSGAAVARGLARFRPAAMRSQVQVARGITLINDCYNANPASMEAALGLLAEFGTGRRTVAVLGEMLELGPEAEAWHRRVGARAAASGATIVIACGALGRYLAEGARTGGLSSERVHEVADAGAAARLAGDLVREGDVVLIKGSRGMKMEQVVERLFNDER